MKSYCKNKILIYLNTKLSNIFRSENKSYASVTVVTVDINNEQAYKLMRNFLESLIRCWTLEIIKTTSLFFLDHKLNPIFTSLCTFFWIHVFVNSFSNSIIKVSLGSVWFIKWYNAILPNGLYGYFISQLFFPLKREFLTYILSVFQTNRCLTFLTSHSYLTFKHGLFIANG